MQSFFVGLLLIVMGTGMLKPNISSLVGELYSSSDQARRDAGFSIFYIGINIGATIAPVITSYLGEKINWHYGFAAAGIGMLAGVIQYKLTEKNLGEAGLEPVKLADASAQAARDRRIRNGLMLLGSLLVVFVALLMMEVIHINPVSIAQGSALVMSIIVILYFGNLFFFEKLEPDERNKVKVIAIFFLASAMFYGGYEQQGSSLTFFADRYTDKFLTFFDFEFPSGWFQTVPAGAVLIFAPMFAWLWVWLSNKNMGISTPLKLSFGLIFMGLGYAVMMGASRIYLGSGTGVSPGWLITTYVLHTFGEICLYPIGLSSVTKLSPKRIVGQMMGIWFMSLALGNLFAGLFAGEFDREAIAANPQLLVDLFWVVVKAMLIAGAVVILLNKPLKKLMGNIR